MLSAIPTPASIDFSTNSLHHLVCPVLGVVLNIVALGVSTLYCALKKLSHHEPVAADITEFEEYYSALSSFEVISGLEHLPLQEGDNIPKNDKTTSVPRINGSSVSGAREKIKVAPGRRRLRTELLKESRIKVQSSASVPLVPRERSLSEMEYTYVFWSHCHYEPSIAVLLVVTIGTFPYLYCASEDAMIPKVLSSLLCAFDFQRASASSTNGCSSSIMAEDSSAEPSEYHYLMDPLNVNNFFAEEQMSPQSSPSGVLEFHLVSGRKLDHMV